MTSFRFHKRDCGELGNVFIGLGGYYNAQEYAMLAAMYSRSTDSVEEMVEKVSKQGSGKFMDQFYIGYGHESIGDMVDVRIFLEGIPLYLAPFIEHHSLFRGQESSTRYIDFSKQRLYGPDQALMQDQIQHYLSLQQQVEEALVRLHEPTDSVQKRAIKARSFDVTRGFIPLGAVTNVAWYGNIREVKRHLSWLRVNYDWTVPWVTEVYAALSEVYPESCERNLAYVRHGSPWIVDEEETKGWYQFSGYIDFGSWRDLNRHRVGWHRRPQLPERKSAISPFYRISVESILEAASGSVDDSRYRAVVDGDYGTLRLGQVVPFDYRMPRRQAEYFTWRRNQMDVHPTLRLLVQDFAIKQGLTDQPYAADVGKGYVLKRGTQTIIERGN